MWRSKKFIIITVLAAVLVGGSIGGIVLAQQNEEDGPTAKFGEFLDKVCAIYEVNTGDDIDPEALKEAFAQAQREMREEALRNYLQNLVDNGKITQEQAQELQEWWESRPDVPIAPRLGGHGMHRGFGGPPGWFGPPPPDGFEPPSPPE